MAGRVYFSLGVAKNKAFCNRVQETKQIIDNINLSRHMLIMAPRRYGKTSLALHALRKSKVLFAELDFYMARNENTVAEYITKAVAELLSNFYTSAEKMMSAIKQYLKNFQPSFTLGTQKLELALTPKPGTDPATQVVNALNLLEAVLQSKKQKAALLFDEFQIVGNIAKGAGIEAAIRHIAQKSEHFSLIFSGSNRKLLQTMFEDDNRPLYKLAIRINVFRINAQHYQEHLDKAAKASWKESISKESFTQILQLSERHPYYTSKLCDLIWTLSPQKPPTLEDTQEAWKNLLTEEKSDAIKDISSLAPSQKGILQKIAQGIQSGLSGKAILYELDINASSAMKAIDALLEQDFIEKTEQGYQVISPVIKHFALG